MNAKLLRWLLEKHGYVVQTASDAQTAREGIRAAHPQLVLMDIQLPDVDGLQLTREFKADPGLRSIPIVAVTSYAMKGDRQRAVAAGCAGTASRSFMGGAVVVRSATVAAVVNATANDGVHVQEVASRGTPAPMVLVAGNLEPVSQSRPIKLAPGSNGDMTVTLFY